MLEADRLPEPPEKLPGELDLVEEKLSVWRLHWEGDPLKIESYPTGRFRFDAPAGEYSALYGNADRLATFAEVYGDVGVIEEGQKGRKLSRISSTDALRLVPLDDPGTQKLLGLDGRIGMSKQYPATQRWASKLFHSSRRRRGFATSRATPERIGTTAFSSTDVLGSWRSKIKAASHRCEK
ncbi:MAG: RES family NAD+ phosphorylase [Actinomycetota bacterium]|nr:RES family NAD+ phosphorylase [Actinomycetota bacterium]